MKKLWKNIKKMNKVIVKIKPQNESEYPILIGENLLEKANKFISEYSNAKRFLIVTNVTIEKILGDKLDILNSERLILPDGEKYKNFDLLKKIIDKAIEMKLERKDAIIAFGGGVIGDMAGFAASIYQRGVDFIQIPTTLLSQVDSSVGGKVAINHPQGKNMIGNFYQPKLVLTDTTTLKTLDIKQLKTGLAEVVKYAFIEKSCNANKDYDFLNFLLENKKQIFDLDSETISKMIQICCSLKSSVVLQDEKEQGLRAILNFGHTFAHAIEKATNYESYTHGEAVAIGMKMAINLSYKKKLIDKEYYDLCLKLIDLYGFDFVPDKVLTVNNICDAMKLDKKVQSSKVRFVLPTGYKTVEIFDDIDENFIKEVVQQEL